jgi:DNA-binding winged helix-turn-helix (wHTH) protein/tetratricopeptide (TPR) repeat protein
MKEFHPFRLDFTDECLWRGKERISLTPKSFSLLAHLVEHAGNLVPQSDLIERLWPDTFVQPEVLKSHIRDLRSALGDDARHPRFIETCHRRGYRFIAPVEDPETQTRGLPASISSLVGRDECLEALNSSFQEACKGKPQLVFVTGEIGIGKTTLLNAFESNIRHRLPDAVIVRGQCVEGFGGPEPYYPVLEAVSMLLRMPGWEAVVDVLARHAPTWLAQFPAKVKEDCREDLRNEIAGATTERMLREFFEAAEILAKEIPLVILLEDVHWSDNYTVDWFSAFARGRRTAKLMLVATLRKLDLVLTKHPLRAIKEKLLAYRLCREVQVPPFSEPEVQLYLKRRVSDHGAPEGLARLLYRQSEGNPLFLEAALEQLVADGFLENNTNGLVAKKELTESSIVIPETLSQIVEAYIDSHLSSIEQEVLEAASVCGVAFSVVLVAGATETPPEQVEKICTQLAQRSQVIRSTQEIEYPDGTVSSRFEFVHALYSRILYRRIGRATKARLHTSIGRHLLSLCEGSVDEIASILAYHFEMGSAWDQVPPYLLATARMERDRFAFDAAIAALKRAQRILTRIPNAEHGAQQTEILLELARCYAAKDEFALASEALEKAERSLALRNDNKPRVRVMARLAFMLSRIDAKRCVKTAQDALELAIREKDPSSIAEAKAGAIFWKLACDGWNPQAAHLFAETLETMSTGDEIVYGIGLVWNALLKFFSSRYDEGISSIQTARRLLAGSEVFMAKDTPRTEVCLRLLSGELGSALSIADSSLELARRDGSRIREYLHEAIKAWIYCEAMNWKGSLEICERIFPHLKSPDTVSAQKACVILQGTSEAKLGRYESARRHFAEATSLIEERPTWMDWYWQLLLFRAEADMKLATRSSDARESANRFLSAALASEERTWQALAWEIDARVALDEGDVFHARESIVHALEVVKDRDLPIAQWRVHSTAARIFPQDSMIHQREASEEVGRLADSLNDYPALRDCFLASQEIRSVLLEVPVPVARMTIHTK